MINYEIYIYIKMNISNDRRKSGARMTKCIIPEISLYNIH